MVVFRQPFKFGSQMFGVVIQACAETCLKAKRGLRPLPPELRYYRLSYAMIRFK